MVGIGKEDILFLGENPFYLLGIHSADDAADIGKAVRWKTEEDPENASLYQDAGHILRQGVNRSEAEFYWLTGWEENPKEWVSSLLQGKEEKQEIFSLSPRLHLLLEMNRLYYGKPVDLDSLLDIETYFSQLSPQAGMEEINKERKKAGFPLLTDASAIEHYTQDILYQIGLAARKAAKCIGAAQYGEMLYALGCQGKRGLVYYQLMVCYEAGYQGEIHLLEKEVEMRLSKKGRWKKEETENFFRSLQALLSLWKPLYGRDGLWVVQPLFDRCRNRMIDFYRSGNPRIAEQWLGRMKAVFAFSPALAEKLNMDDILIRQGGNLLKEGRMERDTSRFPKEKILFWAFMGFLIIGVILHYCI